jgi:serine/threonine protein kinase
MGKNTLDVAYIDMMKAEGDKLTNLRHANILSFHHMSIYRSDRSGRYDLYLIMDMMSCSFNQLVFSKDPKFKQQRAKLGGKDRQRILIQIASGLAYLHYHGIVHRNLKPTNILCNDTLSVVKVADFGKAATLREHELDKLDALAASQSAENSENKQRKGSRLYVAAFMAPEQVVSDGKITLYPSQKGRNKVDSYSYAMILYAFTTGLRPYADFKSGGKMFTMMEQILDGLRPTMPSAYPTVLKELLEKCWCKNPNDRLSMTKVQRELQSAPVLKALGDVWVP